VPEALQRRVLNYIRRHDLLRPGDRAAVAVSGGADSVALLRLMIELRGELGIVLGVAHFNHKLRGEASNADEQFVRELAQAHDLQLHASFGDTPAHARQKKLSLETAARELRYFFFRELICSGAASKVMTAHTLDDQAETVLMRVIRGAGTAGLAGIYPKVKVVGGDDEKQVSRLRASAPARDDNGLGIGDIIRPLLEIRRSDIEDYLRSLGQTWREDATNAEFKHARNRVRHVLLPLLEREFNPSIRERLAEMADIARTEEDFWEHHLAEDISDYTRLEVSMLRQLDPAVQRRIIRRAGAELAIALDFEAIDSIQRLVFEATGDLALPGGWFAHCKTERRPSGGKGKTFLVFEREGSATEPENYEYALRWPAQLAVYETGQLVSARLVERDADRIKTENVQEGARYSGYNHSQLLDAGKLLPELTVRNWRPGDRFWPSHTSGPKKVKQLLQERHVTGTERTLWPVVLSGADIVWMRGFPVSEQYRAEDVSASALIICEQSSDKG
jgi:tRNA(Ile)-lysidine synthase